MPPEKTRPRKKPAKKAKPIGLPSPCPTPFFDLQTSDCFVYKQEEYPPTATCIRFREKTDAPVSELAFDYFLDVLGPITSRIHACIHATTSLLFIADIADPATLARLVQASRIPLPGTALEFVASDGKVEATMVECLAELDMELGLENCPTDFSTPSSSEDERPQARKQPASRPATTAAPTVAKHSLPAVQPTPPTRTVKPAPVPVTQLEPSTSTADVTLPVAVAAAVPLVSSLRSALRQPIISQLDAASTPAAPSSAVSPPTVPVTTLPPATPPTAASPPAAPAPSTATDPVPAPLQSTSQPATGERRRHGRFRFRAVDFQALQVVLPPSEDLLTVLIRPVLTTVDLRQQNSQKIAMDLGALGEPKRVRDIRNGGLAVDFPTQTPTAPLLALSSLAGCQVVCTIPASEIAVSAVVSGIHPEISEEDILQDMVTSPPTKLLAVKRLARPGQESWSVKLTVEGTQLPERALLYGRSRRVTAFINKPLQCQTCGRFGHVAGACRSKPRCLTCGEAHDSSSCPSKAAPSCGNCGGPHPVDADHCPARQMELKVCKVKAAHGTSFRVARNAVQNAARSYAAAIKTSLPKAPADRPPASQNRPPPLQQLPVLGGGFTPNTAHARSPPSLEHQTIITLFKSLLTILAAAATSNDLSGALLEISRLFMRHAPGADAAAFAV